MSLTAFVLAVLALLVTPGPTNTLIGVAGAQGGLARVLRLLPAELLGYLTTVLPLAWLGAEALARYPGASAALKLAAGGWVLFLALRLWRAGDRPGTGGEVSAGRVYVTTMLNPKALIFGLVLLPAPGVPDFPGRLGLFATMVIGVALAWGAAGRATQGAGATRGRLLLVQRIASLWLTLVGVGLLAGALRA